MIKQFVYFEQSLQIQLKSLPNEHTDLATTFNGSAAVYCDKNNYVEVIENCEKALKIKLKSLPINRPDLTTTYFNMTMIKSQLNIKHFQASLAIMLTIFKETYSKEIDSMKRSQYSNDLYQLESRIPSPNVLYIENYKDNIQFWLKL
jgi:hypothetical protein